MVLCDTNVFIYAFNGNTDTQNELGLIGLENIIISSITVMELYQGMGNKKELQVMKKKIKYYDVLQVNAKISKHAIQLIDQYNLSHGLTIADAIIGASAVICDIELFTYNTKDFRFIPNIKLRKI